MSEKTRELIQEAIQEFQSGDEARLGSYQDLVADLLHLARSDEILRAEQNNPENPNWDLALENIILEPGNNTFLQERQEKEYEEINAITDKELPLFIGHDWSFKSSEERFNERIKDEHIRR